MITLRFLTSSYEGVKLAESLCAKPLLCLTIFYSSTDHDRILSLKYPDYFINIIQVKNFLINLVPINWGNNAIKILNLNMTQQWLQLSSWLLMSSLAVALCRLTVNIEQVQMKNEDSPLRISLYCPHCTGGMGQVNVWNNHSLLYNYTPTNCCPYLKGLVSNNFRLFFQMHILSFLNMFSLICLLLFSP